MEKINKEDIYRIRQHCDITEDFADQILKRHVYSDADMWKKFLHLFFLALGVGFTVSGIIFFFAYNWDDLHKFTKLGILETLLVGTVSVVLFTKLTPVIKNAILTGAAMLVGALFAVFGQIYQTGADAYDLFLVWTAAITLWVVISNFASLWLVYITLINITLILYSQQIADHWPFVFTCMLLFALNSIIFIFFVLTDKYVKNITVPLWFRYIIALAAITFGTIGICSGIIDDFRDLDDLSPVLSCLLVIALYVSVVRYSLVVKNVAYIVMATLSTMIIISTLILRNSFEIGSLLLVTLFITFSVVGLTKVLMNLQKEWNNGK